MTNNLREPIDALNQAIEELASLGHTTTCLNFIPQNSGARLFYESLGFAFQESQAAGEPCTDLGR